MRRLLVAGPRTALGSGVAGLLSWRRVRGAWVLGLLLLLAVAAASAAGHGGFVATLAAPLILSDPLRPVDAVVVLGQGAADDGTLTPNSAYALLRALDLVDRGYAGRLVLSGGSHRGSRVADAEAMGRALQRLRPGPLTVLLDPRASSVAAHAQAIADLARRHGLRSVAVVTSPLRSRRTALSFRRAGLDVVSAPGLSHPAQLLIGRDSVLGRWTVVLEAVGEYAALTLYRMRGHV